MAHQDRGRENHDRGGTELPLDPFQRAALPKPEVAHQQDPEEHQHLDQPKLAQHLIAHGPRKKEDRFHIEDHEQDSDEVEANGVASACIGLRRDAALVGHQLFGIRGRGGAQELQHPQSGEREDDCDRSENQDRAILVEHSNSSSSLILGPNHIKEQLKVKSRKSIEYSSGLPFYWCAGCLVTQRTALETSSLTSLHFRLSTLDFRLLQCSVRPWAISIAWGSKPRMLSNDSRAPRTLPGRFTISLPLRTPATLRESAAVRVDFRPSARINSARPGTSFSRTARVASGVTSRGASPVPPVVKTASQSSASVQASRRCRI